MSTKTPTPVVMTAQEALKAAKPTPTAVRDIPTDITITVANVEGQSRTKYQGFLDEAKTIQVSLYYPTGMDIPAEGQVLVIGADDFNPEQGQERTRRGSTKLAWGDLNNSDSYGAAAFVPQKLRFVSITAVLAS